MAIFFSAYQQGYVSFSKHITIQRRIGQAIGLLGTALQNVDEFDISLRGYPLCFLFI